jgi:hypothetical protein
MQKHHLGAAAGAATPKGITITLQDGRIFTVGGASRAEGVNLKARAVEDGLRLGGLGDPAAL